MREEYEKRAESIKDNLLTMFRSEYAKIYDIYQQNVTMCERIMKTDKGLVNTVLAQELAMSGIEHEFSLRRVPKI